MLQQTTVAAVVDYYRRFLEKFPTLDLLAAADVEEVIEQWAGLGYYSRARNLHRTARLIVEDHGGCFPDSVVLLQQLPGIGRSTAGAIVALAFEQRAAILDGNVRRVLCRLCALQQPPRLSAADRQLWLWSEQLTPAERVHDYTQAIMDLGATVCTPRQPRCGDCPVVELCLARRMGLELELPLKQSGKAIPTRVQAALLIEKEGAFLIRRRPAEGFLGGLWEFPDIAVDSTESGELKINQLKSDLGFSGTPRLLGRVKHTYSHFHLDLSFYRLSVDSTRVAESSGLWQAVEELDELALHGAHKKALNLLRESENK